MESLHQLDEENNHQSYDFEDRDSAHERVFRCSYLESKTEPSVAKAQDYIGCTEKMSTVRGDTAHTFLIG